MECWETTFRGSLTSLYSLQAEKLTAFVLIFVRMFVWWTALEDIMSPSGAHGRHVDCPSWKIQVPQAQGSSLWTHGTVYAQGPPGSLPCFIGAVPWGTVATPWYPASRCCCDNLSCVSDPWVSRLPLTPSNCGRPGWLVMCGGTWHLNLLPLKTWALRR